MIPSRAIGFLSLFASGFLHAASCENIIHQINQDSIKYSSSTQEKNLPWANLVWLKKNLGNNTKQFKSTDNTMSYQWTCKGILSKVEGRYSSEDGSHLFSLCVSDECGEVKSKPPIAIETKSDLCNSTAKNIYNTSIYYQNKSGVEEETSRLNALYIWENKAWLQKSLGTGTWYQSKQGSGYTWTCPASEDNNVASKNTVSYIVTLHGDTIVSSNYCTEKKCYYSFTTRVFNRLKTHVTEYSE
jgi:hypothetical protein